MLFWARYIVFAAYLFPILGAKHHTWVQNEYNRKVYLEFDFSQFFYGGGANLMLFNISEAAAVKNYVVSKKLE